MVFGFYKHYYDDYYDDYYEQYKECFICFDYKTDFEKKTTSLQKQQLYFSNCNCDTAVHNACLKNWIYYNKSCPICRNNIVENNIVENNNITTFKIYFLPWGFKIYLFTKKISINLFKFLFTIAVFYLMVELYLISLKSCFIPYNFTNNLENNKYFNQTSNNNRD